MQEWVGKENSPFVLYLFFTDNFIRMKRLMIVTPFVA